MIISSVLEADPSREERSILALTKKAQMPSGQANKIQMRWPLFIFKLPTIAKLFFGKEENFFVREKSLSDMEMLFKSEDLFLANMPQISVHFCDTSSQTFFFFCLTELVSASCYQQSILLWGLHTNR